jgi:hypothetical protein
MIRTTILTALLVLMMGRAMPAEECCDKPCCPPRCPNCKAYCKFEWDKSPEEKYCWCIECKPICIPKITFPWQSCCDPKCAKLKWVNVLKKVEYECPNCKCKWTAVEVPCKQCGQCSGCKSGGNCSRCASCEK